MKTKWIVAALAAVASGAWGQALTLDQAVAAALDQGPDNAIVSANLLAARAGDAQNQAKAGLTVASSLGWTAAKGVNDPVANLKLSTTPTRATSPASTTIADDLVPQQASGTVTLSTPMTSLALTGAETFQTDPDGTLLNSTTVGANLSQTLLTGYLGGSTQATADKSTLTWQTAVLNAAANKNKVILNVKNAFFTLLAAQDRVTVYVQTLSQRQDALKFTQAKAASGTATDYDVRAAKAAVRSAELDLAGGRGALTTAQVRLANLLGSSPRPDLTALPVQLVDPAASVEEAIDTGLKNRVELQTTALSAQSSAIDAALANGAILPTIVLTGGVSYTTGNAATPGATTNASSVVGTVGVKVTPPNIDAGLASNQALQARTLQGVFQTQLEQLRRSIPVDIRDAWTTWQLNGQRYDLARTQVDIADVNRQIIKSQFDSGTKLISDWLTAEVAYSTAQLNVVNALLLWQQSAATLQNLMGL